MDRRGYSRSPSRQGLQGDSSEQQTRTHHETPYDNGHSGRYDGADDGYSRREGGSRYSRHYSRDSQHDYGGMYDERPRGEDDRRRERSDRGDRSRDDYRFPRGRQHYRSRSPRANYARSRSSSPTREAGRPTDTVILEGLPFSTSAIELQDLILNNSIAAEFPSVDVRVSSSKGGRRAFLQFEELDHAVAFVKEHFPKLYLELEHPTDDVPDGRFEAYIHYARSRDEGEVRQSHTNANWICPSCDFSNFATRAKCKICGASQSGPNWRESLTGMSDAADVPSQILVVYPLAPFVDEEMLARDMKRLELQKPEPPKGTGGDAPKLKSTAPTGDATGYGARPGSLHRVFLMRDSDSNESFRYGFAEFWTLEDAAAAMTKFKMSRNFTIAACSATLSTIHMGVFVPEDRPLTPAIERISFNPLFNPSLRVKYRDPHVYPSQLVVTSEPPVALETAKNPDEESSDPKKGKKRKADGNLGSASLKKSVPMAGQMAMWQRKHDELVGTQNSTSGDGNPGDAKRGETSDGKVFGKASEQKGPIKISLSGSKNFGTSPASAPGHATTSTGTTPPEGAGAVERGDAQGSAEEELYMDRDRLMCLICMRKYKSLDEVSIHEKSRKHRTAMEDGELVKAALPRIAARDKRIQAQLQENDATTSQYRDRAKERRQAFNQSKKQPVQTSKAKPDVKTSQEDAPVPPKPAQSKGAGMLAKMGWTAGAGLGANGDGRTEVIATNAYQEGVGLGAEGGNLGDAAQRAEKKTKSSYADYVNEVQDKARERYNRMG